MSTTSPAERDALAAEYVLGLLDEPGRATAERMIAADAGFARAVEDWRSRLAPIDDTARTVPAGADLWQRIAASLPAVRPVRAAAPVNAGRSWFGDLWDNLGFWRLAGLAGAAASVVLAVGLLVAVERSARTPVLVAVLVTDANEPAAVVNAFADGRTELVPLAAIPVPEGRALEIWTLWDRQVGPRSVGLIGRAQSTRLRLDNLPLGPNQLFEITLEPVGGSPVGRPTGPILMKGLTNQAL